MVQPTASPAAGSVPATRQAPGLVALSAATRRVLHRIRNAGGRPMVVGGSVRDALMHPGRKPKDIDIEVYDIAGMDQLVQTLRPIGRVDEVGRSFGVLKMTLPDGTDLDISLPRRDSKTGTGHRGFTVDVGGDIGEADATGRRDYTVNAMMWDPATETVVDHWGGLDDLDAKVLRHCTEAFADDPLRVLRGVQFACRFGFTMAPETVALSQALTDQYADLARERVWGEWEKLLGKGQHFPAALEVLDATGWLAHFPELSATQGVAQDPRWHPEGDVFTHLGLAAEQAAMDAETAGLTGTDRVVVVAAALLHDLGKVTHTVVEDDGRITSAGHAHAGVAPATALLSRLGAPTEVIERVGPLVAEHMCATGSSRKPTRPAVRRLARRLTPATITEWSLVCGADQAGRGPGAKPNNTLRWLEVAATLGVEREPTPLLLRGDHLMALGHKPSAAYKKVMAKALEAQDSEEFTDETGAVAWLHQLNADGVLERWLAEAAAADQARADAKEAARQQLREQMKRERPARRAALRAQREQEAAARKPPMS